MGRTPTSGTPPTFAVVVLSVAAERAADRGHWICRIVHEFVRRFFFWWREREATVATQRIGRTVRVQKVASGFSLWRRPIRFLTVRVRGHDKDAHGLARGRGLISGKLVLRALEQIVIPINQDICLRKFDRLIAPRSRFNRDLSGRLPSKSYDTKLGSWVTLDEVLKANDARESMFHLIWYLLIGLISGVIAKSVMHVHLTMFWTIVLGIVGSILGGAVTHVFSRPKNERYHPAGLIFSTLGAILVLYICYKLKIHFPQV